MPNSSVFIFLMLCGLLYSMICKNWKKKIAKNGLNVTSVKLLSNFFFNDFGCFLMLSCFQPLIESKNVCFWLVVTFYYSKKTTKTQKNSKFIKEKKVFPNWTSVKLFSKIFFNDFGCFLMLSCFQPLI